MRALLIASIVFFARDLASAIASPTPTPFPDHVGGKRYGCDDDIYVTRVSKVHAQCPRVKTKILKQCTRTIIRPEYHTITTYKARPQLKCNSCEERWDPTLTICKELSPCNIPYPFTSTIFQNVGATVTVTVTTTTTTSIETAETQPVKNGGFVSGLANWKFSTSNGAIINSSNTVGLFDFANSSINPIAGLDSAGIYLPTNVTSTGNPAVILSQSITLLPSTQYVLSFFIDLSQSVSALATLSELSSLLSSLLNTTNLSGIASTTPLAALVQCQVSAMIQTTAGNIYGHIFPFATISKGTITPVMSVDHNGTSWTRLDTYFNTTASDSQSTLSFTFQCPGLMDTIPNNQLLKLSNSLKGLTGTFGNLLSTEGATQVAISIDQVTLDYYANP